MTKKEKIIKQSMAFPVAFKSSESSVELIAGLSKRELFAAMALQGFCSWDINKGKMLCDYNDRVDQAVKAADALIAALDQDSKRSE
jgi:hypothetical protein